MKYCIAFLFFCIYTVANAAIDVKDYMNRSVALEKPARRIVALAPHIVENLYSAGAGEYIVGAVDYCDYPESAQRIPRVGGISSFSIEAIIDLKPDLVIAWRSGRGGKILEKLERLGLTVYASDPRRLTDVARSIRDFGELANTQKIADKAAQGFESRYRQLKHRYSQQTGHIQNRKQDQHMVKTLYQVWHDPIQTINGTHIISDVIRLCGGVNIFGKAMSLAPKISVESVVQRDPHVIIASGMGESRPDWLDSWKRWPSIDAVQHNRLHFIAPDIIQRHTVRILDGAALMCQYLANK
ncbi:cobalamin-binding protein [Agarilytica rhodophyticola]|uniref:cobalamin-binding protein n=1 Tax=Agarilytica rhodophyticola TaxID=1737490 RepID=UPI000B348880|nr:cobalamin-binding protein [Agarilytica rhodophyticola]